MLAGIILAVSALGRSVQVQWSFVIAWAVVLVLIGVAIDSRWRRFQSIVSEQPKV
jgi:hypothetical protein